MELTVESQRQNYSVYVENGAIERLGIYLNGLSPLRWAVVTDETVAPLYGECTERSLRDAGLPAKLFTIPAGEGSKTLAVYEDLCRRLIRGGMTRMDGIVALGGGVVGDVAGFAAATLLRGVPLVQVPTTLLAQVDSAVGGKTAVDLPEGKNLLGAFYPPQMVVVDPVLTETLPERELRSGMAEVIKYGMIADESLLTRLETGTPTLEELVEACLRVKCRVVSEDEYDRGIRRTLNFGHTFGHMYEAMGDYSRWRHGEAVAAGMAQMLRWQCAHGCGSPEVYGRLKTLLEKVGLPTHIPCPQDDAAAFLRRDKKMSGERIAAVAVETPGKAEVISASVDTLTEGLA